MLTTLLFLIVMFLASLAGGALSAVALAGKELGNELAAMMGALYGGAIGLPAAVVSAVVLRFA